MDLAVLLILIIIVVLVLKDVKWVTYLIGIVEIFLRLIHYIGDNLKIASLNNFINEYFPTSIFAIIGKYSSGVVYDILSWVLVLFLIWFLIYLVKYLFGSR
ncbi:MAG TPA: hypothetical protein OIM65_02565 [Bacilli bacterium]|jgi:hypothetical protein|nr:unknown [Mycoplasma sp. CAG:611]HJJ08184.1 hypothetical protein [Bacilli bacterium]